jgi:hypothetical protein
MPVHELAPKTGAAAGSNEQLDQQLRTILENLQQVMKEAEPVEKDDLSPGIAPHLDHEVLERDVAIENRMKRRSSRRFARYLIAICFGVVGTLAWQSYGRCSQARNCNKGPGTWLVTGGQANDRELVLAGRNHRPVPKKLLPSLSRRRKRPRPHPSTRRRCSR